ncbi:MAG: hypothetical protein GX541_04380, partial [Clostridiales bacterium]|nr:hypothetical protein [Clostridiales bacterium]
MQRKSLYQISAVGFGRRFQSRAARNREVAQANTHIHDFFQLWYIRSGKMRHFVDGKLHIQSAGELIITPPLLWHSVNSKGYGGEFDAFTCDISQSFMLEIARMTGEEELFRYVLLSPAPIRDGALSPSLRFYGDITERVEQTLERLCAMQRTEM